MSRLTMMFLPLGAALLAAPAFANVAADLRVCAAVADDGERLACFDNLAASVQDGVAGADTAAALAALDREFRFDRSLRVAPTGFRLEVSQYLSVSRETGPGRDVQRLASRINRAIGDIPGWSLEIVVHGASVAIPRARPLSGAELQNQAVRAMAQSGLAEGRYEIVVGPDAAPRLWDDGRVRGSNEHITVEILGL